MRFFVKEGGCVTTCFGMENIMKSINYDILYSILIQILF